MTLLIGAYLLCGVSNTCHIIYVYMGWTLVDSSRVAAVGMRTSVEAVLDAAWDAI
jgi:hypothetical protein